MFLPSEGLTGAAGLRPHLTAGGDEVFGFHVEAFRRERDQGFARGRRAWRILHAAALDAVEPAVRPWSGVSAVSPSTLNACRPDAELLGRHLAEWRCAARGRDRPCRRKGHGAVAVHGKEGIDLLGVEHPWGVTRRACRDRLGAPASAKPTVSAPP